MPTAPVTVTRRPAPGQGCRTPARARLVPATVRTTAAALQRNSGRVTVRVAVAGVGRLRVLVLRNGRQIAATRAAVVTSGRRSVIVTLPPGARRAGQLTLRLRTTAPVGRATRTASGTLVIR
jgi:hypothetical protein